MQVAIVGGSVLRCSERPPERLEELAFAAGSSALADAGIRRENIDNLVIGTSDELDGRPISSMLMAAPAGAVGKDEIKVQDSAMHALVLAAMRIASGEFDLGVVVSWSQSSQVDVNTVDLGALEPFVERPGGAIEPVAAALTARAYLDRYGRTVDDLDARATAKGANGGGGDWIGYPLRARHFGHAIDGAAALVLASPQAVAERDFAHTGVWLRSVGWATDTYALAERDLAGWPALRIAGERALGRAGITADDLDHVEVNDRNVVYEALAVEALGLAEPGRGFDALANGEGARVNRLTSTAFDGLPLFCGGLFRAAQAALALRDKGTGRRVLVHDASGIRAQNHAVAILERS